MFCGNSRFFEIVFALLATQHAKISEAQIYCTFDEAVDVHESHILCAQRICVLPFPLI